MPVRKVITAGLLLFVGFTLAVMATRGLRAPHDRSPEAIAAANPSGHESPELREGLVAYYFHGSYRCPTCRTMESYAREAIVSEYAAELARGSVQWRVVNYEQPDQQALVKRYHIVAPMVILSRVADGLEASWSSLDKIWYLTDDKAAFQQYVREAAKKLQAGAIKQEAVAKQSLQ